jgi:hypothetical protein
MNRVHLGYRIFFALIAGLVLLFIYGSVASLLWALEELQIGDLGSFGVALFFSFGWGFTAAAIGFVFYQVIKSYFDARTLIVPEDCPECKEGLHHDDLKWIEPEKKAECPHCGIEIKVTKEWE